MKALKENAMVFSNGLLTGLSLQLAVGPCFFYVVSLALKNGLWDGLAASLAVASVDWFYIGLSIIGIGKILKQRKFKKLFGFLSSIVLIILGGLILKEIPSTPVVNAVNNAGLFRSFYTVFILTLFNPLTIVFYTSLFTAKTMENNYSSRQLNVFGFAVGLATLLFFATSISLIAMLKVAIPFVLFQTLNIAIGVLLIFYSLVRLYKISLNK